MITMAYAGLTIESFYAAGVPATHSIPAYPEYTSSTTFDDAFYVARRTEVAKLVGGAIVYTEAS